jgi:hypothetical protein
MESGEPLLPEQQLALRGSGIFEVGGMRRYLVEVPVIFWTTRLAEYVLCANVQPASLPGIPGVPRGERGWWYAFIEPGRVTDVARGELCFGLRQRLAVRVRYGVPAAKSPAMVYLSCDDRAQWRVLTREWEARTAGTQGL